MSNLQQQLVQGAQPISWLESFQQEQTQQWLASAWPTRKTEAWKYAPLKPLETGNYTCLNPVNTSSIANAADIAIPQLDSVDIVFVNGKFNVELSDVNALPEGVEVCLFADANEQLRAEIKTALNSVAGDRQHMFTALNGAQLNDGVYIKVHDNAVIEKPLRVVWYTQPEAQAFAISQRLLVSVGKNAQATVVEQFVSSADAQNSFTSAVTELLLSDNSHLHHYRLHQEQEDSLMLGGVYASLARSAVLNSFYMAFGSRLQRLDVVVDHQGEGAHCEMNGVYLPSNSQYVDFHTCIEHAVPHCTTNETFRGIIADSAKAVFNGRIHIHKDAQKTLAQLSNKNLLTSNKAEVDTKPELEIYADDVQCAHGATVAQLDKTSLHYLRTRGVSTEEAIVMLSFGFINELVDRAKHQPIADYLRPMLATAFAKDPELIRHITDVSED